MLHILNNRILIELENNDLWQLVTMLRDGMKLKAKHELVRRFAGTTEESFLEYAIQQCHPQYRYIGEMYYELDRKDKMDGFNNELMTIFKDR